MEKEILRQCKSCSKIFESQVDYSTICAKCELDKTPNPQETAKSMISDRIVTKEMARKSSINWIESGIKKGGYPSEVIAFWKEVLKELKQ